MKSKPSLKDITLEELHDRVIAEEQQLSKLQFNHAVTSSENPLKIRLTRREIARLKTEIRKRELQSA